MPLKAAPAAQRGSVVLHAAPRRSGKVVSRTPRSCARRAALRQRSEALREYAGMQRITTSEEQKGGEKRMTAL